MDGALDPDGVERVEIYRLWLARDEAVLAKTKEQLSYQRAGSREYYAYSSRVEAALRNIDSTRAVLAKVQEEEENRARLRRWKGHSNTSVPWPGRLSSSGRLNTSTED